MLRNTIFNLIFFPPSENCHKKTLIHHNLWSGSIKFTRKGCHQKIKTLQHRMMLTVNVSHNLRYTLHCMSIGTFYKKKKKHRNAKMMTGVDVVKVVCFRQSIQRINHSTNPAKECLQTIQRWINSPGVLQEMYMTCARPGPADDYKWSQIHWYQTREPW